MESETSNQLEMLALEKTPTANTMGVVSGDMMLVSLVDDTPDPPLDVAREIVEKIAIIEPDEERAFDGARTVYNHNIGSCIIRHLQSLDEIYLQKVPNADKMQALLGRLYVFYEEGTPEPLTEFEPETFCAAKSSDGNWYRASIVSSAGTDVTVQFVDYDKTETIAGDMVKKLDASFYEPCVQALLVSLGLEALNDEAIYKLSEWTREKEVQVMLASGTDGVIASLHLDGVDLSMKLVNEKLASPQITGELVTKTAPVTGEPVLPSGCTQVYISHIDSPGEFWLQMADKVDKIGEIKAELANADKYEDLNPEMGALCVAKDLNDLWFRAEVLDVDSNFTTVRFVDYGYTYLIDLEPGLIKVMPEKLRAIEPLAVRSSVNAVPSIGHWSRPAVERFDALVGDMTLAVDALIVFKDATTYVDLYVDGRNVTDHLVSEGHATRAEKLTEYGDLPSCFVSKMLSPSELIFQSESATPELQAMQMVMENDESLPELASPEEEVLCDACSAWNRAEACQLEPATPDLQDIIWLSLEEAEYVPKELESRAKAKDGARYCQTCLLELPTPELQVMEAAMGDAVNLRLLASPEEGVICAVESATSELQAMQVVMENAENLPELASPEDGARYRQACQLDSATPELKAMEAALEDAENLPYAHCLYYGNKCKEFRVPDASNKLDELTAKIEVDTKKEVDQDFEDVDEQDSSDPDLDDSTESTHTVIENKSFEANPHSLNDSGHHKEQPDSPKQDINLQCSDTFKDSVWHHSTRTSSDVTKASPEKANNAMAEITTVVEVEIETKEVKTEMKEKLNVKTNVN